MVERIVQYVLINAQNEINLLKQLNQCLSLDSINMYIIALELLFI